MKTSNAQWYINHINALKINEDQFKKLRRIERKLSKIALQYCNGDISEIDERVTENALKQVLEICPKLEGLFFNTDPRGYALKTKKVISGMHTDWGGYGIVAPEF